MAYQLTIAHHVTANGDSKLLGRAITLTNDISFALEKMKKSYEDLKRELPGMPINILLEDIKEVPDVVLGVSSQLLKAFEAVVILKES